MPVFLFAAGTLMCVIGLFLIGFFIPNRDFSVGGTFILAGTVSIVGGILSFGLAGAIRELRKLAKNLDKTNLDKAIAPAPAPPAPRAAAAPARPAPQAPPQRAPAPAPARPVVVNTQRTQRAEPRLEAQSPDLAPHEPPPPSAPTIADVTAAQPRGGLFASIRGRAAVQAAMENAPPSVAPPQPPQMQGVPQPQQLPPIAEPEALEEEPELPPDEEDHQPQMRAPSLSALAARTAARLDLPRPVPDLPRVMPDRESEEPAAFDRSPEPVIERPARNVFDTVWPTDVKPSAEPAPEYGRRNPAGISERHADVPPAMPALEPRQPEILKSGVIDGMGYTLYTDGSIEAQLPQGTLRFSSIDDLRAHLDRG